MLDVNQQRVLATWVNKNSKRLNDRVAKARSQADFRAVLAEATEYFNQLRSERDTHGRALDETLQLLEKGPTSEQGDAWATTEIELQRDAEIRRQVIAEFDRHIGACEALIAWVQGQLAPDEVDAAAVASVSEVSAAPAAVSSPAVKGLPHPALNLKRMLVIAGSVLGIVVAVWLLLSLVRGPQSASGKPPAATAVQPAASQSGQALVQGASTPARTQATPLGVASASPAPIAVAAAAETARPTNAPARATETPTTRPAPTRTPSPAFTATSAAAATPAPTSTSTSTATRTLEPTSTAVPTTAVTTATTTPAPTREVTRPAVATATPLPPRPSPAPASPNPPVPLEPRQDETRRGNVTFVWQPGGPLPTGAAYEVVWWNAGEDPAAARGIAATTTETSLTANLDPLYTSAQLRSTDFYWTVIVVQTSPYVRLTQPAQSAAQHLNYASPSGGEQPAPPKPREP